MSAPDAQAPAPAPDAAERSRRHRVSMAWTMILGTVACQTINTAYLALLAWLDLYPWPSVGGFLAAWVAAATFGGWVLLKLPRAWMHGQDRVVLILGLATAVGFAAACDVTLPSARTAFSLFGLVGLFAGLQWISGPRILVLAGINAACQVLQWAWLSQHHPERLDGSVDLIGACVFMAAGIQVANLGRRALRLHERLRQHTAELDAAVAEIDRLARTDELTGSFNRRHVLERLEAELAVPTGPAAPLAVMLLDLDHFKRINDTWGHAAGDVVLQRVVGAVQPLLPPHAIFGRQGGEEFLLIVPARAGQRREAILDLAECLRQAVAAIDLADIAADLNVTTSIGLVMAQGHEDSDALIAAADRALYRAKAAGRNRIVDAHASGGLGLPTADHGRGRADAPQARRSRRAMPGPSVEFKRATANDERAGSQISTTSLPNCSPAASRSNAACTSPIA